ncbi:hypothetical protein BDV06DRAFT_195372 [Aspergillus oleicola]
MPYTTFGISPDDSQSVCSVNYTRCDAPQQGSTPSIRSLEGRHTRTHTCQPSSQSSLKPRCLTKMKSRLSIESECGATP